MKDKEYTFFTTSIKLDDVELKGDSKEPYVTGYIATQEIDRVGDMITDKGMDGLLGQLKNKNIKIDVEHEAFRKGGSTNIIPIGRVVEAKMDATGIKVKVLLNQYSPVFKTIWGSIKKGFIDAFSISYKALDYSYKTLNGANVRVLDTLELLNVAMTGIPVNKGATIEKIFMKSLEEANSMTEENNTAAPAANDATNQNAAPVPQVNEEMKSMLDSMAKTQKELVEKFDVEHKSVEALKADLAKEKEANTELRSFLEKPQLKSILEMKETPAAESEAELKSQEPESILGLL